MMASLKLLWANKLASALVFLAAFALGVVVSILIINNHGSSGAFLSGTCPTDLTFVKAEQDCGSSDIALNTMSSLQDDLTHDVNAYITTGRASRISVFVRDLNSQRFATVNPTESYFMASLLKVPLAVAYYRLAEVTPDILDQKITYNGDASLYALQDIQPQQKLIAGTTYAVKDLIFRMLAYSDNAAAALLTQNYVSDDYLQKILVTIGLPTRQKGQQENMTTAMSYAGVFRTLYYSAFLSREYSDDILNDLSQSTFTDGAVKLLPNGVVVSHKFGERSVINPATGQATLDQLHDCGIVYGANGTEPYSFCIMTEGKNFPDLESAVQNISATIYGDVVR